MSFLGIVKLGRCDVADAEARGRQGRLCERGDASNRNRPIGCFNMSVLIDFSVESDCL